MFFKSKTMRKILKYVWTSLALCGLFLVVASCEGKCEDNLLDDPEEPSVTENG